MSHESRRHVPRPLARGFLASIVTLLITVVVAPAAGADGAQPSNFRSVIDSVTPDSTGIEVRIVGGDAFFEVAAPAGTAVDIPGYDGEPYLRIDERGVVQRNVLSGATYLNERRSGSATLPDVVDSSAAPEWETIGAGGTVAWHDHRIHWMLDDEPLTGDDGVVQAWSIPMEVDGTAVTVEGRLVVEPAAFPWAALLAIGIALGVAFSARHERLRLALLGLASATALGLSSMWFSLNPPGASPSVLPIVLPALAILAVGLARFTPRPVRHLVLPLAAVALLAGWIVGRVGVFWMSSLPTPLIPWIDRALTAAVAGVVLGVGIAVMVRPYPDDSAPSQADAARAVPGHDSTPSTSGSQSSTPPRS